MSIEDRARGPEAGLFAVRQSSLKKVWAVRKVSQEASWRGYSWIVSWNACKAFSVDSRDDLLCTRRMRSHPLSVAYPCEAGGLNTRTGEVVAPPGAKRQGVYMPRTQTVVKVATLVE